MANGHGHGDMVSGHGQGDMVNGHDGGIQEESFDWFDGWK